MALSRIEVKVILLLALTLLSCGIEGVRHVLGDVDLGADVGAGIDDGDALGAGSGAGAAPGGDAGAGAGVDAGADPAPGAGAGPTPGAGAGPSTGAAPAPDTGAAPGAGAGAAPGAGATPDVGASAGAGATVFDVTKYGAKGDGKTDNAMMFIRAWNAACQSTGPAKVVIPEGNFMAGEVFFKGPCKCSGPIIVEVVGTVLGHTDLIQYTAGVWIGFQRIDGGLLLTGKGTFNAQGEASWKYNDRKNNPSSPLLPISLKFQFVKNALVENIKLVNSKGFHMTVTSCNNFTLQGLRITAPDESPNTDGIHISRSDLVKITNSVIGTGDDCISIGEGSTNIGVSGVTCGPGHGISIGSLGRAQDKDVKGVTVTNCSLTGTTNGARIKTIHNSPQIAASSIVYDDIIMKDVKNPIIIDQHYGTKTVKEPSKVKISDVHFKNIRGTSVTDVAVSLSCSEAVPCEGIELVDIDLTYSGTRSASISAACSNAKTTFTGKQNPPACA
uniref:Putative Ole e 13.01 allergen n=1 Tax=Davidia involucrata TaxID=16924 RepID=A0A5B6Z6S8_DAVIN